MVKFKIYDGEDTIEAECELLAVCGLSRPGSIVYQFRTDFAADRAGTFALLAQISAQLQAASIDVMREAEKIAKEDGVALGDEFMKHYEKAVYGIEKQIKRGVGPEHGEEVADDDADV